MVADDRNRNRPLRTLRIGIRSVLAIAALAFPIVFRNPLFRNNIGIVEPGRVVRSAQPRANLRTLVEEHRLAAILNLRGGSDEDAFYRDEVELTRRLGIAFYDFPMSATRRPTRRELLMLFDLFGRSPYPLLIHCKSGSDRTGLASALYLLARGQATPEAALRAFSLGYGHVPLGGTARLHEPFLEYRDWLQAQRLPHTPARLRAWIAESYRDLGPRGPYPPLQAGPRASLAGRLDR